MADFQVVFFDWSEGLKDDNLRALGKHEAVLYTLLIPTPFDTDLLQSPGSMAFNWFFPQDVVDHKTPSRMNDGIPLAMEMRYRKEGAKLVINAANNLNLYPPTTPVHCLCGSISQSTVAS